MEFSIEVRDIQVYKYFGIPKFILYIFLMKNIINKKHKKLIFYTIIGAFTLFTFYCFIATFKSGKLFKYLLIIKNTIYCGLKKGKNLHIVVL
jgi:hypothetical protein